MAPEAAKHTAFIALWREKLDPLQVSLDVGFAIAKVQRTNSTNDETADGKPRNPPLRVIPATDVYFSRLFGLREESEAAHHRVTSHLINH